MMAMLRNWQSGDEPAYFDDVEGYDDASWDDGSPVIEAWDWLDLEADANYLEG